MKCRIVCMGVHFEVTGKPVRCENANKPECPMQSREWMKLAEEPCCRSIVIPAQYLTEAKQDVKKAARRYIEECMSE